MNVMYYRTEQEKIELCMYTTTVELSTGSVIDKIDKRLANLVNARTPFSLIVDKYKIDDLDAIWNLVVKYKDSDSTLLIRAACRVINVLDTIHIDQYGPVITDSDKTTIVQIGKESTGVYTGYLSDVPNFLSLDVYFLSLKRYAMSLWSEIETRCESGSRFIFTVLSKHEMIDALWKSDVEQALIVLAIQAVVEMTNWKCNAIFVVKFDEMLVEKIAKLYRERVSAVYLASVMKRDFSTVVTGQLANCWNVLNVSYSNSVMIDRERFAFKDIRAETSTGKIQPWKPINQLAGKSLLRRVPESLRSDVEQCVSYILSKKRDIEEKLTVRREKTLKKMAVSLIKRKNLLGNFPIYEQARKAIEKIEGTYFYTDKFSIVISADPVDILRKSTGQDWEAISCEKDGGTHFEGVFSDIEIGNAVAFLRNNENGSDVARMMLRWCVENDKNVRVGIEKIWYASGGSEGYRFEIDDKSRIICHPNETVYDLTIALVGILDDHGLYISDVCETPYTYMGYSDTVRGSKRKISYYPFRKKS